jgi:hypothetical protein
MTRQPCSECGSDEFYVREVDAVGGYGPDLLPGTGGVFHHGKFQMRVCGRCGHIRWFVPDRFLDDIRERGKFQKLD